MPKSPPQKAVLCGDIIDWDGKRFYLGSKIGEGRSSRIYECKDEWGNELVAKVSIPKPSEYEGVKKIWQREVANLTQLRHPNIAYIHAAFECENVFFIIVERCFSTLFTALNDSILKPTISGESLLLYAARDILHGLDFIHSHGYSHEDLHFGNVFLTKTLDPPGYLFKIGDLGLAQLEEEDINPRITFAAASMLPPEVFDKKFGLFGKKFDIMSAGILLLGLLMGEILSFNASEFLRDKPRKLAEAHPSPYAKVIAKALQQDVKYRTQSAIEFWRELQAVHDPQIAKLS